MGINKDTEALIRKIWVEIDRPMVFDADALTILAGQPQLCGKQAVQAGQIIITPHPGEMGCLLDKKAAWVQENRLEAVKSIAKQWGVIAVLKGARTLIADPQGTIRINSSGNPGMASAGMGDVLSGMIAGLLTQGMAPFDAAATGVWMHGAAADRLTDRLGPVGMLASDIMPVLPELIQSIV